MHELLTEAQKQGYSPKKAEEIADRYYAVHKNEMNNMNCVYPYNPPTIE